MLFGAHPDATSACTGFSGGVRASHRGRQIARLGDHELLNEEGEVQVLGVEAVQASRRRWQRECIWGASKRRSPEAAALARVGREARGFGEGRGGARGRAARRLAAGRRWELSTEREVGRRGGRRPAVAGNRRDSRVVGCARRTGSDGRAEDLDRTDRTGRRSDG